MTSASISGKYILLLLFVVVLQGCGTSPNTDSNSPADPLVVATLKGPSSMGMIRMIDSLRRGEGHIEVEILNEPLQVRKMMLEQSADFVILPTTMAALLYNKGLEYRVAAIPVWGSLYLFAADSTFRGWEDLRSQKIHLMARGMTPDVLFRHLLALNKLDPDRDVRLDYSFPTHIDLANAVAAGKTEFAVISEPMASMVEEKNNSVYRLFRLSDAWEKHHGKPLVETSFMVRKEIIREYPNTVEQVLRSYEASTHWVNFHPDSAAQLLVNYGISPNYQVALSSIQHTKLKFVRAKGIVPEMNEYLEVFKQMNPDIIGGKIPDESFVY